MAGHKYEQQVKLLLSVLPIANNYSQLALKGGTAINLFVQPDMRRLSVDIDLVYLNIEDRETTFNTVDNIVTDIATTIRNKGINIRVAKDKEISKIFINSGVIEVKLEINPVTRGVLYDCIELPVCNTASDKFQYDYTTKIVSLPDLYASKICAALSRKHPRDLFDVKLMLERNTMQFDAEFMNAIVIYMSCSNKAFYDLLDEKLPPATEFTDVFINKFEGMTNLSVTPEELIDVYQGMLQRIHNAFTNDQRSFILSLANGTPDWELIPIHKIAGLPGLAWKLKNIELYKNSNPDRHSYDMSKLAELIK